jgi:hypothetical protein
VLQRSGGRQEFSAPRYPRSLVDTREGGAHLLVNTYTFVPQVKECEYDRLIAHLGSCPGAVRHCSGTSGAVADADPSPQPVSC